MHIKYSRYRYKLHIDIALLNKLCKNAQEI